MSKWLSQIKQVAPALASALTCGKSELVISATKALGSALLSKDNATKSELEEALKDISDEELVELQRLDKEFAIKLVELSVADVQHARQAHKSNVMTSVFSMSLVILATYLTCTLLTTGIPDSNRDIIVFIVGQVFGYLGSVSTYWLGRQDNKVNKI